MSAAEIPGARPRTPPPLGSRSGSDIQPPATQVERDTGSIVLGQGLIGLGNAILQGDPARAAQFRKILLQVQRVLANATADQGAAQEQAGRIERQDGVATSQTGAGLQLPGV